LADSTELCGAGKLPGMALSSEKVYIDRYIVEIGLPAFFVRCGVSRR
jgi:hypothetical protein